MVHWIIYTVKTWDNPVNTKKADLLREAMEDTGSTTISLKNKAGLNKDSDTVQGMIIYDADGHISTCAKRGKEKFDSSSARHFDLDEIDCGKEVPSFISGVRNLLEIIRGRIPKP